jgi:hypothetical protein
VSDHSTRAEARVPELLESLVEVVGVALNNGIATFYVSLLVLAIGLCCVRGLWERVELNGRRSDVLNQLMQAPQEPLRPDTAPMLSSAVLSKDIARWELCHDGAGKQVGGVVALGAAEFWRAYDRSLGGDKPRPQLSDMPQLEPVVGLAPARTDADPGTRAPLVMPSALVDHWPRDGAADPTRLAARVQASLDGLEAIRPMLDRAEPTAQSAGVVRFFFVSVDGFMRYTLAPNEARDPSPLPPFRTFNHTSYVLEALAGHGPRAGVTPCGTAYETVPYFDILGGGVVATVCHRMPEHVDADHLAQGVLCADVALPRHLLIDKVAHNPLISAELFVYDDATRTLERCTRDRERVHCHTREPVADAALRERVRKWLQGLQTPSVSGYAGASPLTTVGNDTSYDYAAVLWQQIAIAGPDGKPHALFGLVLFNIPPYTFDLISWAWLGGTVLCLALLVYLLGRQRVALARQRTIALQRGLSVGVVQVDKDDRIVGVNDRAEFLIGDKLPRLGLTRRAGGRGSGGGVTFLALVDNNSIVVRDGKALTRRPYSYLAELRKEGVSSVYWIRLARRNRWLKVTGAPVFESTDLSTVGLLEPADPSCIAELEAALDAAPGTAGRSE